MNTRRLLWVLAACVAVTVGGVLTYRALTADERALRRLLLSDRFADHLELVAYVKRHPCGERLYRIITNRHEVFALRDRAAPLLPTMEGADNEARVAAAIKELALIQDDADDLVVGGLFTAVQRNPRPSYREALLWTARNGHRPNDAVSTRMVRSRSACAFAACAIEGDEDALRALRNEVGTDAYREAQEKALARLGQGGGRGRGTATTVPDRGAPTTRP